MNGIVNKLFDDGYSFKIDYNDQTEMVTVIVIDPETGYFSSRVKFLRFDELTQVTSTLIHTCYHTVNDFKSCMDKLKIINDCLSRHGENLHIGISRKECMKLIEKFFVKSDNHNIANVEHDLVDIRKAYNKLKKKGYVV